MSRAIVQEGYNKEDPLSTLRLVTNPIPKAAPGHVVVNIKLRPINPTDLISIRGGNVVRKHGKGVPGSEGYGIVHEVGAGVTKVKQGQRVVPLTALGVFKGEGSWQEYISLPQELVWPVPDFMSDETAAQFVINPWTSTNMLRDLGVPAGEYVVQSAAGSVLGKQVIKLAKHWGIKTINVVRRAEQREELKQLGADEVIVSTEEDVVKRVKEITGGKGAWGALDAVYGNMAQTMAASVRDAGQVFVYGMLGGTTAAFNIAEFMRLVCVRGWVIYSIILSSHEKSHACAAEVAELLRAGVIQTAEMDKYDLADFRTAIQLPEKVGRRRKIALTS